MDTWLARHRAATQLTIALTAVYESSHFAHEGKRFKISSQLSDLAEEIIHLHREVLELAPEATPAACEFERAELDQPEVPF